MIQIYLPATLFVSSEFHLDLKLTELKVAIFVMQSSWGFISLNLLRYTSPTHIFYGMSVNINHRLHQSSDETNGDECASLHVSYFQKGNMIKAKGRLYTHVKCNFLELYSLY